MKVAIIGAGVSGLACAFEFKKNGIVPVVFERKSYIGQGFNYQVTSLRMFDHTLCSPYIYLKKRYGLHLTPCSPIHKEIVNGPRKKLTAQGHLGYLFKRGEDKDSLENQIASAAKVPIYFDSYIKIENILGKFDYIIISTGDGTIAKELGVWTSTFNCLTRVASVIGRFQTDHIEIWFDTRYAKNTFCFLAPKSSKQAYIALSVDSVSHEELNHYWEEFLATQGMNLTITQIDDHEQTIGYASPPQMGNILFTGNTAGLIDSFLGFGTFKAIESGILAARAILAKKNYSRLIQPLLAHTHALNEYRKAINTFSSKDYDHFLSILKLPGIKQSLYNNPLAKAEWLAPLARLYNRQKK